jgi:predicted amidohydrolase
LEKLNTINADLIVLPELPFTGYYFKDRNELSGLAEEVNKSSTMENLVSLCKEQNFYLVTGFAEKYKDKIFNSAILLGPGGVVQTYRKLHLFNKEKEWFDPGDMPLHLHEVRGAKLGLMVCFDWIFPEMVRSLSLMGADIICHPSNLVLDYCQQTMISRCLENGVFAITANRFGADRRPHGTLKFTGKSQIVAPKGDVLFRSVSQKEVLHLQDIDPNLTKDKHMTPLNDIIEDRRPEFYKVICK